MAAFSLSDNRYFNKFMVNRLNVNNLKVNSLNVEEINERNQENMVVYKSVDTLIEEFDKNELILVTQKCLNRIKNDFSVKSEQHTNYDQIMIYENEFLMPTYRSLVSLNIKNMIKVDDTTYSLQIEKDSIKSIIHNDFIEKSLIMSVHTDFNSIQNESVKDFSKFCVNAGLDGPGVVEIYTSNKAYIAFIRKFNNYDNIEVSFINTHKNGLNEINFHYTNEDVTVDIENFKNKTVHLSIPKSIYNANSGKEILKFLEIGLTLAVTAVANVIPGIGEAVDVAETGFLDAELTADAVSDTVSVGAETSETVADDSILTTEASTSEADLSTGEISEDIDNAVENSFKSAFKELGNEMKLELKNVAKQQIKKWLKSKLKIAFKKTILKGAQATINALIFHGIEYSYAVAVLGKTSQELESNQNWTNDLPKWLTKLSSIQFIQIKSNAQAKDIKLVVNKRAVRKAVKNTVKTIGKDKLNEIFDSATSNIENKLTISNDGISIDDQDIELQTPIKNNETINMNNISRLHNNQNGSIIVFTSMGDRNYYIAGKIVSVEWLSYQKQYIIKLTNNQEFTFTDSGNFISDGFLHIPSANPYFTARIL